MSEHTNGLNSNIAALLTGQVSRLIVQAAYFVVLARMLGPNDFGLFAVVIALGALAAPFTALGANTLMVRNVARNSEVLQNEWTRSLAFTIGGGLFFAGALTLVLPLIVDASLLHLSIYAILFSDLIGLKLVDLSAAAWHTIGRSKQLVALPTILNLLRLAAAGVCWLITASPNLESWALWYLMATVPLGVAVAGVTSVQVGLNTANIRMSRAEAKEGVLFSISMSSQSAFNDLDKTMLANLQSAASAGIYTAAYRVIDMAYAPIRSVAAALYPRLFRAGGEGLAAAFVLVRQVGRTVLIFGILGSCGVFVVAPFAPQLLGAEYQNSVQVIQLLAPLILLRGVSFLAADFLSAVGRHGFRTIVQLLLVVMNVILNLLLIPQFQVAGAVISTLSCEAVLATVLWLKIASDLRGIEKQRS